MKWRHIHFNRVYLSSYHMTIAAKVDVSSGTKTCCLMSVRGGPHMLTLWSFSQSHLVIVDSLVLPLAAVSWVYNNLTKTFRKQRRNGSQIHSLIVGYFFSNNRYVCYYIWIWIFHLNTLQESLIFMDDVTALKSNQSASRKTSVKREKFIT